MAFLILLFALCIPKYFGLPPPVFTMLVEHRNGHKSVNTRLEPRPTELSGIFSFRFWGFQIMSVVVVISL